MKGGESMTDLREAEAMALMTMARGLGYVRRQHVTEAAGSALAVVQEPERYAQLLTKPVLSSLREVMRDAQRHLDALRRDGIALLIPGGEGYPLRLASISRPPQVLFVRGQASLDDPAAFAVVGTRSATRYGLTHTRRIARELAEAGICVVSGLALGIDAAAHLGALDAGGRTIAVLGSAHDRFYPAENYALMERILAEGGSVVTEDPPGKPPTRYSFLERNRIIAGLGLGVLVTEGAQRSGALRTAHDALDEGREVFALPGSVESENSALPHMLIADGAHLAVCGADILRILAVGANGTDRKDAGRRKPEIAEPGETAAAQAEAKPAAAMASGLDEQEQAVYAALRGGEADFDVLCDATGIAPDELGALLTMMEMDGHIDALPGLRYRLA